MNSAEAVDGPTGPSLLASTTVREPQSVRPGNGLSGMLAGVLVTLVTLIGSWNPSLWTDEAATISAAERDLPDLWRMLGSLDLVHGFYYLCIHAWVSMFGPSAFSLRLPSALATGVAAACVYWLGTRLGGRQLAVWAVVIFAVLPRVFWAGIEGRSYAMTAMFAAAATLALMVALDRNSKVVWVAYSGLALAGILSNLFVGLLIAAHLVSMFWDRTITRVQRIRWAVAAGAACVISAPFLIAASRQAGQLGTRDFGLSDLAQNVAVNQWFLGDTPTTTTGVSRTTIRLNDLASWWLPASLVVAAIGWLLMAYAVYRALRVTDPNDDHRSAVAWLVPWIVIPTAVIGVYSVLATPMYSPRYLTFAAPAVALLMASGLLAIPQRRLRLTTIIVLVLAVVPIFVSQRQIYGKNSSDWISASQYVEDNARSGDGVYFAPRYDVPGETVGQTTRGILTAYPRAFDELLDVTLLQNPDAAGDLTGASRRLADSSPELSALSTLWVVRRLDYPEASARADDAFLLAAGFSRRADWAGPLDEVVRYDRTS